MTSGATVRRRLRPPQPSLASPRAASHPSQLTPIVDRRPLSQIGSHRRCWAATNASIALPAASGTPAAEPVLSAVVPCDLEQWERARAPG